MYLWRISNHRDLSGRGGLLVAGRWHERGTPVVYCSDHPSTALLEVLVHVDLEDIPPGYTLLKITCPGDLPSLRIEMNEIDIDNLEATRLRGSSILDEKRACLIDVPSAVMPEARNILINPLHPRAAEISIERLTVYPFDSRLLR